MDMKEFIEIGQRKAGNQAKLAKYLEISDRYIRLVKEGKRGLADDVCIKLADYIGADRLEVIAASNLVTEKDDRKRKIFESCFKQVASVAGVAFVIFILTLMPTSPAHADSFSSIDNKYKLLAIGSFSFTSVFKIFCHICTIHL